MISHACLVGAALCGLTTAYALSATAPALAAPVCIAGFQTTISQSWRLECRKLVPFDQLQATVAQAENAVCNTDRYWNFGPKVTVERARGTRRSVTVIYLCGHVEG